MEARLFEAGTVPEWTTPEWYEGRETAPHLDQDGHRERIFAADAMIRRNIPCEPSMPPLVVDLGAGDGGLLSLLNPHGYRTYGYDLQQSNVDAAAARGVDIRYGNVLNIDLPRVDCYVATEMLEHLVDPHGLVARIHASGTEWLVASSPYTEHAGPGGAYAFHTWCWDTAGYVAMVEAAGYAVVEVGTAWICTVLIARRR